VKFNNERTGCVVFMSHRPLFLRTYSKSI
jgi:hypothetical protein